MFWLNVKQYIRTPAISLITVVYFLYLSYVIVQMPHENVPYTFIECMNQIKVTFIFSCLFPMNIFQKVSDVISMRL